MGDETPAARRPGEDEEDEDEEEEEEDEEEDGVARSGRRGGDRRRATSALAGLLDISGVLNEGAGAIADDSFWKCFQLSRTPSWNWNWYLLPLWTLGVLIRYCVLFPLRLVLLLAGFFVFGVSLTAARCALPRGSGLLRGCERQLAVFMCSVFVASWTGVIKYHGPLPARGRRNTVFVANHTSMIDFIVLEQLFPFAVIMQRHPGWVGFIQQHALSSLGCIEFNRTEAKDRHVVARRIREHVTTDRDVNPLLVFPEGVCVNNEYCVRFKKGVFDLGDDVSVYPIAMKYNKIFVDAHWNSRKFSFSQHLFMLMTSWAVVCDVHFLEPQRLRRGETSVAFAERVRVMIANKAGLKMVEWDGYLKYVAPSPRLCEERREKEARRVKALLAGLDGAGAGREAAAAPARRRKTAPPGTSPIGWLRRGRGAGAR